MATRALLVGCATFGLRGVTTDLDLMESLLADRGFEVRRQETDSTREGILGAFRELVEDTIAGDSVVLYYSGHGARLEPSSPGNGSTIPTEALRAIVPLDADASVPGDLRLITGLELAAFQQQLVNRTDNVVVALDCCYSGRLVRDTKLRPRSLANLVYADLATHLAALPPDVVELARAAVTDTTTVRLVAAGPDEQAMEFGIPPRCAGVFTRSLVQVLQSAAGMSLPWTTVMTEVRRRVQRLSTGQRPTVEGPGGRIPFTTRTAASGAVPVTVHDSEVHLLGGQLGGVEVADRYLVLPPGSMTGDPAKALATVQVIHSDPLDAVAKVLSPNGFSASSIPFGALAFCSVRAPRRLPVTVTGESAAADALRAGMSAATHVRLRTGDDDSPPLVVVAVDGFTAAPADAMGPVLLPRQLSAPYGIALLIEDLDRLAQAALVRSLTGPGPQELLREPVEIDVGIVVNGTAHPLAGDLPPAVFLGQPLYVRVRNDGRQRIAVHAWDIGVDGQLTLLTSADSTGETVPPEETLVLGANSAGDLVGMPVTWPGTVPRTLPRTESLLVLVASEHVDLSALIRSEPAQTPRSLRRVSGTPVVRYAMTRFDMLLYPIRSIPTETSRFTCVDHPDPSYRLAPAPATTQAWRRLSLVLTDLRRERTDHSAGEAELRLDALVVTGPDTAPRRATVTVQVTSAEPGSCGTAPAVVLFEGPAAAWVDLALWASPAVGDAGPLETLLPTPPGNGSASTAQPDGRAPGGPGAEPAPDGALAPEPMEVAARALRGVAGLVDAADAALRAALVPGPPPHGLYRGSWVLPGNEETAAALPVASVRTAEFGGLRFEIRLSHPPEAGDPPP